ncbi:MAG: VCBS repeat-containing protein, partial [Pirellulaceae bacterium]
MACFLGCAPGGSATVDLAQLDKDQPTAPLTAADQRRVAAFCGDCHAMPRAESFPRDRWHFEVKKGYEFYAKSGRSDLDPPPMHLALAYYRARAPQALVYPPAQHAAGESPVKFVTENLFLDSAAGVLPEIAHLQWTRLAPDEAPVLVACDMRYGHVVAIDLRPENRAGPRLLAQLRNPCHVEACDLDGNGTTDLVVADLGSFLPAEHDRGRVVWLDRPVGEPTYEVRELATGLGRVADVRAIDVDGDGRLELIVAEFGWQQTGSILLLRNGATEGERPRFESETIDDRPGTIHVPVHDFNADGRPDFAALVSQEYETVDLFMNAGGGRFARHNVWAGPDLTFGASGLELVDLDGDLDSDILLTNGDAFDNAYASPGHGVRWLENRGGFEFVHHPLTELPGVYRALPADFDGDKDQDIVAVAWLPPKVQPATLREAPLAAIVLLEQTAPGEFARHTLERGLPAYATVAVGDFDADGA